MDEGGKWKGEFGLIFVRVVALSSGFRARARALGFLGEEMGLRVEFIIGWRRVIVFSAISLSPSVQREFGLSTCFGSNPADLFGWGRDDEDLLFPQDTSAPEQFAQHRKLLMAAQKAALKQSTNSEIRRLSAQNKSFNRTDAQVGDSILFHKDSSRKSAPRRPGPAGTLDVDEAGATVEFQSQTSKVARNCVRKMGNVHDAGGSDTWTAGHRRS